MKSSEIGAQLSVLRPRGERPRNSGAVQQELGGHAAGRSSLPLGALHAGLAAAGAREGAVAAGRRADPRPRGRGGAGARRRNARELVAEAVEAGGYGGASSSSASTGSTPSGARRTSPAPAPPGRTRSCCRRSRAPARRPARGASCSSGTARPERARIWAMMETPRGDAERRARSPAAHPRLEGFVLGTNDLVKDLGAAHTPDRLPLVDQPRALPAGGAGRGARLRRRGLQRLPGRGGPARRLRPGARHGLRRQDADPSRPARRRQRGLRALGGRPGAGRGEQVAAFEAAEARGEGVAVVERPDRREPARRRPRGGCSRGPRRSPRWRAAA